MLSIRLITFILDEVAVGAEVALDNREYGPV